MTASKPVNREGRPRGPVRSSTRTATDGRRCLQARQPPRSAPRSRRTESTAPTRVLGPRTPNFQGSRRGPVRGSRGPDRSSRPRARRTTARPKPDPCRGAKSRSPDEDRVPPRPDGSWREAQAPGPPRRRAPDRQGSRVTENFARHPMGHASERIPSVPCDRTRSPPLAPAGRTSRPGTKSHPKF